MFLLFWGHFYANISESEVFRLHVCRLLQIEFKSGKAVNHRDLNVRLWRQF